MPQHSLSKGNWTESLSGDKRTESLSQDKRSYWVLNWVVFLFSTWSHYHYFSGWWSRSLEFKQIRRWLKRCLFIVYNSFNWEFLRYVFPHINLNFLKYSKHWKQKTFRTCNFFNDYVRCSPPSPSSSPLPCAPPSPSQLTLGPCWRLRRW